jgi:hypothetical protein
LSASAPTCSLRETSAPTYLTHHALACTSFSAGCELAYGALQGGTRAVSPPRPSQPHLCSLVRPVGKGLGEVLGEHARRGPAHGVRYGQRAEVRGRARQQPHARVRGHAQQGLLAPTGVNPAPSARRHGRTFAARFTARRSRFLTAPLATASSARTKAEGQVWAWVRRHTALTAHSESEACSGDAHACCGGRRQLRGKGCGGAHFGDLGELGERGRERLRGRARPFPDQFRPGLHLVVLRHALQQLRRRAPGGACQQRARHPPPLRKRTSFTSSAASVNMAHDLARARAKCLAAAASSFCEAAAAPTRSTKSLLASTSSARVAVHEQSSPSRSKICGRRRQAAQRAG